ncbi:hypothetical protein M378DRAFT_323502 [Amanita muscaria Koide BX008]|uniref:C2H2-type domain-containing protein n=1 Tax=Amanita muscaria (strain Koide BX008) TaxID=946122 RepID=A0A0C2SUF6_AMAMK|nr:hypothetical protein M378DRAFT_323502 [Amanita muscaria Koide BX008]
MHQSNTIDVYPYRDIVDGSYFPPDFSANANSTSGHPISTETWSKSPAHAPNLGVDINSPTGHQVVAPRGSQEISSGFDGPNATNVDDTRSYRRGQAADTPRPQNPGVIQVMGYRGNFDSVPLPTPTSDGTFFYEEVLSDDGVRLFRCSCGKETKRAGDMRRHHESLKHSLRKHGCPWCERRYTRQDALNRHEKDCKKRPRRECEMGTSDPHLIAKDKKPRKKRGEEWFDSFVQYHRVR